MNFKSLVKILVAIKKDMPTCTLKEAIAIAEPDYYQDWSDEIDFLINRSSVINDSVTTLKTHFPEGI